MCARERKTICWYKYIVIRVGESYILVLKDVHKMCVCVCVYLQLWYQCPCESLEQACAVWPAVFHRPDSPTGGEICIVKEWTLLVY